MLVKTNSQKARAHYSAHHHKKAMSTPKRRASGASGSSRTVSSHAQAGQVIQTQTIKYEDFRYHAEAKQVKAL